jgi:hypothetical protein
MTERPTLRVRLATRSDAAAIAEIYNEGIEERIATFETALRSAQDVEAQLAEKGDRFPTVVVERNGQVVAWATAGPCRARPVYAGVAEHSVYVSRHAHGAASGGWPWKAWPGSTRRGGSGSSSPASSPRTLRASRSTSEPGSAPWACTAATDCSRVSGATASSWRDSSVGRRTGEHQM